jgi:hypothetical protein
MTKPNNPFKLFYESMAANEQPNFIKDAAALCDVSLRTIYRWIDEPEAIRKPYREIIAKLANKTETELFNATQTV